MKRESPCRNHWMVRNFQFSPKLRKGHWARSPESLVLSPAQLPAMIVVKSLGPCSRLLVLSHRQARRWVRFPACSENLWPEDRVTEQRTWFLEPWEHLRNGVKPTFMMRFYHRRPRSHLVWHSFLCSCHDVRQHFETVRRDESVNGPAHLSLLSEPAFLQFQGKLWQLLIPQNTLHGFKVVNRLFTSDSCFFFLLSSSSFFLSDIS